jgi:hypothetical protein
MKKRYTEEQIIGFLGEADSGVPIKAVRIGFNRPGSKGRHHQCLSEPEIKSSTNSINLIGLNGLTMYSSAPASMPACLSAC